MQMEDQDNNDNNLQNLSSSKSEKEGDSLDYFDQQLFDLKQMITNCSNSKNNQDSTQDIDDHLYSSHSLDGNENQVQTKNPLLEEVVRRLENCCNQQISENKQLQAKLESFQEKFKNMGERLIKEQKEKQEILKKKDQMMKDMMNLRWDLVSQLQESREEVRRLEGLLYEKIQDKENISQNKDQDLNIINLQEQMKYLTEKLISDENQQKIELFEEREQTLNDEIQFIRKKFRYFETCTKNHEPKPIFQQPTTNKRKRKNIDYKAFENYQNSSEYSYNDSDFEESQSKENRNYSNNAKYKGNKPQKKQIKIRDNEYKNNRNLCVTSIEEFMNQE